MKSIEMNGKGDVIYPGKNVVVDIQNVLFD